jgi:hypothetical protein
MIATPASAVRNGALLSSRCRRAKIRPPKGMKQASPHRMLVRNATTNNHKPPTMAKRYPSRCRIPILFPPQVDGVTLASSYHPGRLPRALDSRRARCILVSED